MSKSAVLSHGEGVGYAQAWALQHQLVEERVADRRPDTLLLLEH
jgi:lipoate-protein ligase B